MYASIFTYACVNVSSKQYPICWEHIGGIQFPLSLPVTKQLADDYLLLWKNIPISALYTRLV